MITTKLSFLLGKRTQAMVVFPFIIIRKEDLHDKATINHEKIHIKQQLEMLIFLFFIWYWIEYLIRLVQYKNMYMAYKNISFERESYGNEFDLNYVKNRKFYSFLKYLYVR